MNLLPSELDASGRYFGQEELDNLRAALNSGTLNSTNGTFVTAMEREFTTYLAYPGVETIACNSGTAAMQAAIASLSLEPGGDIVTGAMTDAGAVMPILWAGHVINIADVDPMTMMVTPHSVAAAISEDTRAIVVTHLLGNPADIEGIMRIARSHGIPVIEDCSQAYGATVAGRHVGLFGDVASFSLQQTKHITTGEGGLVVSANSRVATRARMFVNKARNYSDTVSDHHFLADNLRMTDLQGAVGVPQVKRLPNIVRRRIERAELLKQLLADIDQVAFAPILQGATHSFWKVAFRVRALGPQGASSMAARLQQSSIPASCGYQRSVLEWSFLKAASENGKVFSAPEYPSLAKARHTLITIGWNDMYSEDDVRWIAREIFSAAEEEKHVNS